MLKKIAIIHFGGIDRLLFAAPAIIGLKRKHEASSIAMFVDDRCKDVLAGWEIVDSVYPVDIRHLLDFSKNNVSTSVSEIFDKKVIPRAEKFDLVVNLSTEPIANLLATYLPADEKIGSIFNADSEAQIDDPWSQYQAAVVGRSILNPFHMADLYKYITRTHSEESGIEIAPYPAARERASAAIGGVTGLKIGLVLSHQWPVAEAIAYSEEILTSFPRATIFLLPPDIGGSTDKNYPRKFQDGIADRTRVQDLSETSGYSDLHALTDAMHMVIGPLTTTTHLAAACGTFTISLTFLDQQLFEAGPYGHGHIVIADENQDATELAIPSTLAAAMTKFAISTNGTAPPTVEQWRIACNSIAEATSPQFKILVSTRVAFHQQDGIERTDLIYSPILSKGATLQECLLTFYRLIWQFDLNGSEDTVGDIAISRTSTISGMINLVDALERLHKIANFGATYARYVKDDLRKNDLALARQDSEKLQEIDNLISAIATEIPALAPLCNFYAVSQYQNRDSDPLKVSEFARLAYERLQVQITIVLDLVQELVSRTNQPISRSERPEAEAP